MPLVSVFTPTHDVRFLHETWASLKAQTAQDFEWILVPNGKAIIPDDIAADPRVRVVKYPHAGPTTIGALKRFACVEAKGELLVELDHDDLLRSDALAVLLTTAAAHPDGFYYSDFLNFFDTPDGGTSETYSNQDGWETYDVEFRGKQLKAMRAFDPDARSLVDMRYCANHVRAWSRSAYMSVGGHDAGMKAADDQDLVCRTYLTGAPFVRVPECLYFYRRIVSPKVGNTWESPTFRKDLTSAGVLVMNTYLHRLGEVWADRHGLLKIDLGGAHNAPPGYTTVDLADADVIADIAQGLPFEDNSVGVVRAVDFIEHLPRDRFVPFMNDVYRVLAPGGWLHSATPSTDGRGAFQDPTHTNYINENNWLYFTTREHAKYVKAITCRFQDVRTWTEMPSEWHRARKIAYCYADLVALKGQRIAGPQLI